MNMPENVAIVMAAEKYGWELVWHNPTEEEIDTDQADCVSDNCNAIWGVFAKVNGEGAYLWAQWFSDGTYFIVRSELASERD